MTQTVVSNAQQAQLLKPASAHSVSDSTPAIHPIRVKPRWRYESPNYRSTLAQTLMAHPLPMLLALQGAGIHPAEGSWILYQLAKDNDRPYHAALLVNGSAYLVSQNNRVFYGAPGELTLQQVVDSWRTKCPNEQTRFFKTNTGLEIKIHTQNGEKQSTVSQQLKGSNYLTFRPKAEAHLPSFSGQLREQAIQA